MNGQKEPDGENGARRNQAPFSWRAWFWEQGRKLRSKIKALRELDAFRELAELEPQLQKWPNAVPLLERALALYGETGQTEKRNDVFRRLTAIASDNAKASELADSEKKAVEAKLGALDERDRKLLEAARQIVREKGRVSAAAIMRKLDVGYNHAALIADVLRAELSLPREG